MPSCRVETTLRVFCDGLVFWRDSVVSLNPMRQKLTITTNTASNVFQAGAQGRHAHTVTPIILTESTRSTMRAVSSAPFVLCLRNPMDQIPYVSSIELTGTLPMAKMPNSLPGQSTKPLPSFEILVEATMPFQASL